MLLHQIAELRHTDWEKRSSSWAYWHQLCGSLRKRIRSCLWHHVQLQKIGTSQCIHQEESFSRLASYKHHDPQLGSIILISRGLRGGLYFKSELSKFFLANQLIRDPPRPMRPCIAIASPHWSQWTETADTICAAFRSHFWAESQLKSSFACAGLLCVRMLHEKW